MSSCSEISNFSQIQIGYWTDYGYNWSTKASTLQREFIYINTNNKFVKKSMNQHCDHTNGLLMNAS